MRHRMAMGIYAFLCAVALIAGFVMANSSNGLSMVYLVLLTTPGSMLGGLLAFVLPGPDYPYILVGVASGFILNLWLVRLVFRRSSPKVPTQGPTPAPR